jgi:hypothetical protein
MTEHVCGVTWDEPAASATDAAGFLVSGSNTPLHRLRPLVYNEAVATGARMTVMGKIEHGRIVLAIPLDLPDGTKVEVDLHPLPGEFWSSTSLDDLAREQKVVKAGSSSDLAGDWPEDDSMDEFLASVREGRA